MGKVKKIFLSDVTSSALHVRVVVHGIVWGLVEHIKEKHEEEEENTFDIQQNTALQEFVSEIESNGLLGDLPISFGKKRNRSQNLTISNQTKSKKQKQKKKLRNMIISGISGLQLPKSPNPRFDNVFVDKETNFPCQIVGLSPKSLYVKVRYRNDFEYHDIPRKNLIPVDNNLLIVTHDMFRDNSIDHFTPSDEIDSKYWDQRYRLFSKYDHGVILDSESWYSITPEEVCNYITKRCDLSFQQYVCKSLTRCVVMDLFCGCGGNVISLASVCKYVIAVDIDSVKIEACKHNARIYDVSRNIDYICADAYQILQSNSFPRRGISSITSPKTDIIHSPIYNNIDNDDDNNYESNSGQISKRHVRFDESYDENDNHSEIYHDYDHNQSTSTNNSNNNNDINDKKIFETVDESSFEYKYIDNSPIETSLHKFSHSSSHVTDSITSVNPSYVDIIILSPPWGGPEYSQIDRFDLHTMLTSGDGEELIRLASQICPNIVLIIPKNTHHTDIERISRSLNLRCCIEDIFLHGRLKMKVVYFGDILSKKVDTAAIS